MLFGLCNRLVSWQHLINNIWFDFLYCFVKIYLNNILIYSKTLKNHCLNVYQVSKRLLEAEIPADIDKYEFYVQKTMSLDFIISIKGIQIDF